MAVSTRTALAALAPEGRVPTTGMGDRMRRLHPKRWPSEALWISALRLSDGERVVFGRDTRPEPDVGTAVEASSAIPGYFSPVTIDGERYVDEERTPRPTPTSSGVSASTS